MSQIGIIGFLGLCFVCFLQGGVASLSPALQGIADGMGMDVNTIGLIQTIPGIFGVLSSILAGKFVGTKIRYKTALLGVLFIALIAAIPMVITNWPLMMFSRICLGFSTGIYYALPPALLMRYFTGDQQRSRLGISNAFASAGGGVMMLISGLLVVVNWKLPFVIFLFPIIPIIFLLINMPEPEPIAAPGAGEKRKALPWARPLSLTALPARWFSVWEPWRSRPSRWLSSDAVLEPARRRESRRPSSTLAR